MLGPRINAGGRIGDSGLGVRLLASEDPGEGGDRHKPRHIEPGAARHRAHGLAAAERALAAARQGDAPVLLAAGEGW